MRLFPILACIVSALVPRPVHAEDALKVIVIDGEEAANIVAEKIAATPVIEVRDDEDRRVAGAIVRFVIRKTVRNRLAAVFRNGQSEVRTLTDAAGQANSSAITPLEPGSFEIDVEVRYPGATGKATIRQTNFRTVAEAKAAGREPGKSTSSNSNAQTSPTGNTAGAAGPTATTPAAATASTAAVSGGGGISKLAVVGLVAGGAAGAGAAVVLSRKEDPPPAGVVGAVTLSQTGGVQAASRFTFSVQATGFDAGSLAYRWEFGDGETSNEPSPTHVYNQAGTFTVSVAVSDARQTVRSETTVEVFSITGTWTDPNGTTAGPITLQLTQSGTTVTGVSTWSRGGGPLDYTGCSLSGTVEQGTPVAIVLNQPPCPHPQTPPLVPVIYRLNMVVGGQMLGGTRESAVGSSGPSPIRLSRQ